MAENAKAERMIRGGGWKYALYDDGEEFLYDLAKDPGETRNLAQERSAKARKTDLREQLQAWLAK